jgi:hypothetical protein
VSIPAKSDLGALSRPWSLGRHGFGRRRRKGLDNTDPEIRFVGFGSARREQIWIAMTASMGYSDVVVMREAGGKGRAADL